MNNEKIIEMINLYFDGELGKSEEAFLFSSLSENQNAREYFRQLNSIRNVVEKSTEDFPSELEERILRSAGLKAQNKIEIFSHLKIFSAISYTVALILLFLSGYFFFKISNYQEKVDNLSQQMVVQSKTIQMLYNSMPGVEVVGTLENKVTIKPKI